MAITDFAGKVKERIEYSSYGRITQRTGSTTDTPFLFGGEAGVETDANGLYYMHARYYNPHLRRFINADPAGLAGGMNFYAYADGDPISMIDPSGLVATSADRNDQTRNDFMAAYNQKQAEKAAAYRFTGYAGVKPEPITGRQMWDIALSFAPGGEAVKALYTSSTGRELGTGAWSQRSDGAVLLQGLVGAATLAPVFPAAGKAFGAIKAERQMVAAVRANVSYTPRIVDVSRYNRVSLSKGTRAEIWERSKASDGKVYDPSGVEIKPGEPWQAGHIPGHKFSDAQKRAALGGWDQKTWKASQRDPDIYRPEKAPTNLGHRHESDW